MNRAEIYGTIYVQCQKYSIVRSKESTGRINYFRVWGIPNNEFKVGDDVSVRGKLDSRLISQFKPKHVLGVIAQSVCSEKGSAFVRFSGQIYAKGQIRTVRHGQKILDLTVRIDESTFVPVIVWNDLAKNVYENQKVGDRIEVRGFLQSREYIKNIKGIAVKKVTNEVSAFFIESVD